MKINENELSNERLDIIFFALSDKNRRFIILKLFFKKLSLTELAKFLKISLAGVSKHLKILIKARIINQIMDGKKKKYELNIESLNICIVWIETFGIINFLDKEEFEFI